MAGVTISTKRGVAGFTITDFTFATSSPVATYDIELRFNTTDQNSVSLTKLDVELALRAFERIITQAGLQVPAATFPYNKPPL
jgi:hypothetical protein